jgi:hypothetical protein
MDKEDVKWCAERIEDSLLEKLAIQEIQDFNIKIEENKIDYITIKKEVIYEVPVSISVMR